MYRALLLLSPLLVGGCATGYVTDWFRSKPGIINPQLLRYGMNVPQTRCVGEALALSLRLQLVRRFQERAAAFGRDTPVAPRLTVATLRSVAVATGDPAIPAAFDAAISSCGVPATPISAPVVTAGSAVPSGGIPANSPGARPDAVTGSAAGAAAAGPILWLNLGTAEAGQSIAIDPGSIQQEGTTRTAWFRMSDPGTGAPSTASYRVRIDCSAKTVQPLGIRQHNAAGALQSLRDYTPEEARAAPAEDGTVLEIAYLSLCT
jgi:hypothetical protein